MFQYTKEGCKKAKKFLRQRKTSVPPTGYGIVAKANKILKNIYGNGFAE